jgi:hypothetical protein
MHMIELLERTAEVCHEINRLYCHALGDFSQKEWHHAPAWQKESAIKGVETVRDFPGTTPEGSHDSWMREKRAEGWQWGPEKDAAKREHPCFLPYEELPDDQKAKDIIFTTVAAALLKAAEVPESPE